MKPKSKPKEMGKILKNIRSKRHKSTKIQRKLTEKKLMISKKINKRH